MSNSSSDNKWTVGILGVTAILCAGYGIGLTMFLQQQKRYQKKRERAFTREDTTALAFQIAKLSQQLIEEKDRATKEILITRQNLMKISENTAVGEKTLEEENQSKGETKSLKNTKNSGNDDDDNSGDELDGMMKVYRNEYKSWRKEKHRGAKNSHELDLVNKMGVRHARSLTHGDIDLVEGSWLSNNFQDNVTGNSFSNMWQQLNMGPTHAGQKLIKIAVIGGGAFGTAMAAAAGRNGHKVVILVRRPEVAQEIKLKHMNHQYLPDLILPRTVTATTDTAECLVGAELIIHALPAQKSPDWIRANKHLIPPDVIYCSTAKGLFLEKKCLLSEAMLEAFGRNQPFAVLSGPSFAKEIVSEQPSSVVVASKQLADAVFIQRAMSSSTFRIYASQDTVGVELGGALKNPLALGAGMIEGLGFGINTMSAYVTRSCAELSSLAIAMGGKPETVAGLSGVGDLMLTAFGSLSRNRTCGMRLVKGEKLEDILATTTVEGVPTAKVAVEFAELCNLHLPIFLTVNSILEGKLKADAFVTQSIMQRPLTMETHTGALSEFMVRKQSLSRSSSMTSDNGNENPDSNNHKLVQCTSDPSP